MFQIKMLPLILMNEKETRDEQQATGQRTAVEKLMAPSATVHYLYSAAVSVRTNTIAAQPLLLLTQKKKEKKDKTSKMANIFAIQ